ncbi:MAG: lysylphosphatidylglycerol synthase domain-containing protein [Gaiella sp.]
MKSRHALVGAISTTALVVALATPGLLGDRFSEALDGLGHAQASWLWAAALAFALMHTFSSFAWREALGVCGTRTSRTDAFARYAVGSGGNAIAPAHMGSAVRVSLFARLVEGRGAHWQVAGAAGAVGATRQVWFGLLVAAAAAMGAVPVWPLALVGLVLVLAAGGAWFSRRIDLKARCAHVFDAFRELSRSPRSLAAVAFCDLVSISCKVAGSLFVLMAFGIDNPLAPALVVVAAVELAAAMPVTPGNAGLASAAVAFALGTQGVASDIGLSVGVAFGALEMLVAIGVGAAGALTLARPTLAPIVRVAAASTATAGLTFAFGATVLVGLF